MRENAIFTAVIEIVGVVAYALANDGDTIDEYIWVQATGGLYAILGQIFVFISFGVTQAFIAKLQERV